MAKERYPYQSMGQSQQKPNHDQENQVDQEAEQTQREPFIDLTDLGPRPTIPT